jgi:hypothetical protein
MKRCFLSRLGRAYVASHTIAANGRGDDAFIWRLVFRERGGVGFAFRGDASAWRLLEYKDKL